MNLIKALVLLSLALPVLAQNNPHIGYVFPASGRQGTSFQVTVGGQFLGSITNAYISGKGAQVILVDYTRPLTPKEFNLLRDKLRELQEKKNAAARDQKKRNRPAEAPAQPAWTAEDEKTLAEIRKKLMNPPNRQGNPAIAETVTLKVTLASEAELGEREIRVETLLGLSNPLAFHVGQFHEFSKPPAKPFRDSPARAEARLGRFAQKAAAPAEMNITVPSVVNGQIMPGEVDRFRFSARKGQRLVISAQARALIPYLADAVPGWFQAVLTLYDSKGKELQFDDDYRFHPDPILFFEVPQDGDYRLEIRDSIYRGREDFVYRITLGETPFITSIFPLGGKAGTRTTVELKGWNLPVTTLTLEEKATGIRPLKIHEGDKISNPVPFAVNDLPETLEQEPNNKPEEAQTVSSPIIVNGRIEKPGDSDVFRFEGAAGTEIVAEVSARRLDSPLDSVLKLFDATGSQLAFNDDYEDKSAGLTTHHADSWLKAKLPTSGTYFVQLSDTQRKGGPDYSYRLRISLPQPDFALRMVPSSLSLRVSVSQPVTVYALRNDGFSNEIALNLKGAPRGFTLSGNWIPAGQDHVRLTINAPPVPNRKPVSLALEGRATIQGKQLTREVVPAEDMMQAFAYRHLVPAKELQVIVNGRGASRGLAKIVGDTPVKIPAGGSARVQVSAPKGPFFGLLILELSDPPEGLAIEKVSPARDGAEIVLQCDKSKIKPGLKGNLIVTATAGRQGASAGNATRQAAKRPLATLPAIPFEVVP